jgi:predicted transposase YdaD
MQDGPGPRPFDVTTRHLIEQDPVSWLHWIGLPVTDPVHSVDSEVSTVLAEVDKVLRVEAASPWYAHIEVQTGHDHDLPLRLLQYHVLLRRRHRRPVESTAVLLQPAADGPKLSGVLELFGVAENQTIRFRFRVVRLWECPVDEILRGGLGILPLAPLADVERSRLPAIMEQIDERFERDATPSGAGDLRAATLLLLGLRYDRSEARQLLQGVKGMRESSTYQAILDEGQVVRARRDVIELGTEKFGPPDSATVAAIERLDDLDILSRLLRRILRTSTWEELLASAD